LIEVRTHADVLDVRVPTPAGGVSEYERLADALGDLCRSLQEREDLPRGVVLRGSASAFCVVAPRTAEELDEAVAVLGPAIAALGRVQPPLIGILEGDAVGPAWELALACDLRLAAAEVHVGSPEVRLGRMPTCGGTQRTVRLAGIGTALRLLLLGELVPAADALALGLVHRVAPRQALDDLTADVVSALQASAPLALAYAKEAVHTGSDVPLDVGLRLETDLSVLLQTTADRAEGLRAYVERRSPDFTGG